MMDTNLTIRCCIGPEVTPHLDDLARLRISVFRDYPYLYDGTLDYERTYLNTYAQSPRCLFVLILEGTQVVGASTGIPMADENASFQRPFLDAGYDVNALFYYGESVLLPAYRGRGVYPVFFAQRERHARSLPGITRVTFCAVERPEDHPLKPAGYRPLDAYWLRQGFVKHPELAATLEWKQVDEAAPTPKRMVFWVKPLTGG